MQTYHFSPFKNGIFTICNMNQIEVIAKQYHKLSYKIKSVGDHPLETYLALLWVHENKIPKLDSKAVPNNIQGKHVLLMSGMVRTIEYVLTDYNTETYIKYVKSTNIHDAEDELHHNIICILTEIQVNDLVREYEKMNQRPKTGK